jgi:hypothetical protein
MIYCTGDSFTDGTGLADKILFVEYPGDIKETDSIVPWSMKRMELFSSQILLFEQSRQENLKLAWPSKLGKLANNPIVNGAVSGASIDSISMGMIHDIEKLKKQSQTPTHVFIGLTGVGRIPIINTHPIDGFVPSAVTNAMCGHSTYVPSKYNSYCNGYWQSHSDAEMLTFYLYHCVCMKNYVYATTGNYPVFLVTNKTVDQWKQWVTDSSIFLLKEYWELLDMDSVLAEPSLWSFNTDKIFLADGHYPEQAHDKFAEYLYNKYL